MTQPMADSAAPFSLDPTDQIASLKAQRNNAYDQASQWEAVALGLRRQMSEQQATIMRLESEIIELLPAVNDRPVDQTIRNPIKETP